MCDTILINGVLERFCNVFLANDLCKGLRSIGAVKGHGCRLQVIDYEWNLHKGCAAVILVYMNYFAPLAVIFTIFLTACTSTTGISGESLKGPHPDTNPSAAVIVHEFADFQCPACRAAHSQIMQPLLEKYGLRIRYEFKHFPLRSIHRYALIAAEGSECAADQNQQKFWEFVDIAFLNQPEMNREKISAWAEELELNMDHFERCMKSHIKKDVILEDYAEGQDAGVKGTPTFFVNGQQVESTLKAITTAIDKGLSSVQQKL